LRPREERSLDRRFESVRGLHKSPARRGFSAVAILQTAASSSYERNRFEWSWIAAATINSSACVSFTNSVSAALTVCGEPTNERLSIRDTCAFSSTDQYNSMSSIGGGSRYLDTFAKIGGSWYFAERNLVLDWSETRPSTPGT
jgi:hypothetical protein